MGRRKGTAVFIASACVSLVVLGCFLLLFLLYMKAAAQAEAVKHDVPYEEAYQAPPEESLAAVVLCCEKAESLPGMIALVVYDAPAGKLTVVGLPPETLCTVDGRSDTLAGHYDYEGVRGAVNGVRALLAYDVDRYLRLQTNGIANLADFFSGVELNPEKELQIGNHTLLPGRQLLDGRQLAELLFSAKADGAANTAFQVELSTQLIQQRFPKRLAEHYDAFADSFFENCESNLSRYDFVRRQKGISSYCTEGSLQVKGLILEGSYDPLRGTLIPDAESLQAVQEAVRLTEEIAASQTS